MRDREPAEEIRDLYGMDDDEPRPDGGAEQAAHVGGPVSTEGPSPGTVRKSVLRPGDDLPCAPRKVLETDSLLAANSPDAEAVLVVWWFEDP